MVWGEVGMDPKSAGSEFESDGIVWLAKAWVRQNSILRRNLVRMRKYNYSIKVY